MYLHAGKNRVIRTKNIIGIFDLDRASASAITRDYLKKTEKDGLCESASYEIPKSFILYDDEFDKSVQKVCFSQISASTLLGRIENEK